MSDGMTEAFRSINETTAEEWDAARQNVAKKTVFINPAVYHPTHYTFGKYEVIDVLEDWFPAEPLLWQVGKYIARWDKKGSDPIENLEKALFYLQRKINKLKEKKNGG